MKKQIHIFVALIVLVIGFVGCKTSHDSVAIQIVKEVDSSILKSWKNDNPAWYYLPSFKYMFHSQNDFIVDTRLHTTIYFNDWFASWLLRTDSLNTKDEYIRKQLDKIMTNFSLYLKELYLDGTHGFLDVGESSPYYDNLILVLALSKLSGIDIDYDPEPVTDAELLANPCKLRNPLRLIRWYKENRNKIDLYEVKNILTQYDIFNLKDEIDDFNDTTSIAFGLRQPNFLNPKEQTEKSISYFKYDYIISPTDSIWFNKFNEETSKNTTWGY